MVPPKVCENNLVNIMKNEPVKRETPQNSEKLVSPTAPVNGDGGRDSTVPVNDTNVKDRSNRGKVNKPHDVASLTQEQIEIIDHAREFFSSRKLTFSVVPSSNVGSLKGSMGKAGTHCLVTGPSGTGKSWFADKLGKVTGRPLVSADAYGINRDGHWEVKWLLVAAKLHEIGASSIIVGIADNMREISKVSYANRQPTLDQLSIMIDCVVLPLPTLDLFKEIQLVKVKDSYSIVGLPQTWRQAWKSKTGMNVRGYVAFYANYLHKAFDYALFSGRSVIYVPIFKESEIVQGWHKINKGS